MSPLLFATLCVFLLSPTDFFLPWPPLIDNSSLIQLTCYCISISISTIEALFQQSLLLFRKDGLMCFL